jgi:hypothetical protein
MSVPTDDHDDRRVEKSRHGRLLRASDEAPHSDEALDADKDDLPAFLSGAHRKHSDSDDFPKRLSEGLWLNSARFEPWWQEILTTMRALPLSARSQFASGKVKLKSSIFRLYKWVSVGLETNGRLLLSFWSEQSATAALQSRGRIRITPIWKGFADWPSGPLFAIKVQLAIAVAALGLLATLILTSPNTQTSSAQGVHQSQTASAPILASAPAISIEKRLDFSPGLRSWLMSGGAIIDKPELAVGETSSPTGPVDQAPNSIPVPGLVILSGLPSGARVSNGTPVNEAQWGVPTGGDELTVIALPSSAEQSFRTSLEFFNGTGSPSGRINLMITHDAPASPIVGLPSRHQLQRSLTKVAATPQHRHRKNQATALATAPMKPAPPILVTGSIGAPSVKVTPPDPPPPIFPFLGFLSPQPGTPTVPPDTTITKSQSLFPESLSDVFKNSY